MRIEGSHESNNYEKLCFGYFCRFLPRALAITVQKMYSRFLEHYSVFAIFKPLPIAYDCTIVLLRSKLLFLQTRYFFRITICLNILILTHNLIIKSITRTFIILNTMMGNKYNSFTNILIPFLRLYLQHFFILYQNISENRWKIVCCLWQYIYKSIEFKS